MTLLLLCGASFGATWVVSPDGTGDFTSISDALWAASPYDTLLVAPGVYGPSTGEELPWYVPTGTTLEGAGSDLTVVDAEGEEQFARILTPDVTIIGLALRNATNCALSVNAGGALLLKQCRFATNSGDGCAALSVGGSATVVGCDFQDNEVSDAFGTTAMGGYVDVFDSTVHDRPFGTQYSLQAMNFDSSTVHGGTVLVSGYVANSTFLGLAGDQYGRCLYQPSTAVFENNTVLGCTGDLAVLSYFARNNIVAHNAGAGIEADNAVANLTWDNDGGDWSGTDWSGTLGNISADPMFRDFTDNGDWSDDDLRLATGSPAIDAAAPDYPPYDHDGVPRPQDGDGDGVFRADIGAYEWGMIDEDGDGWYLDGGDCDDTDPSVHPFAEELPYDGIDQDCDGADLIDVDGDGHDADHQGGDDCDDTDADVHPGAWDIPDNGIDEDCDGEDTHDTDGDGWPDELDCDPLNTNIHPGAEERCNGVDDDCDGDIDEDGVCEGGDTGEDIGECGCGCRDRGDTGVAWLVVLLPAWLWRRRVS